VLSGITKTAKEEIVRKEKRKEVDMWSRGWS
jgi:hypothetical protein